MKIFDQSFVHDIAQDMYDQQMRTKYTAKLQLILREAEQGKFAITFRKEEIPLECIYWLQEKGFELYADKGYNDEWFEFKEIDEAINAKRIRVVW